MKIRYSILFVVGCYLVSGVGFSATSTPSKHAKPNTASKKKKAVKPVSLQKESMQKESSETVAGLPDQKKNDRRAIFLSWVKDMRKKVSHSQARQNQIVAVAAVRGDEKPDSPPLYWKGKQKAKVEESPEAKQFQEALDTALKGEDAAAKEKFQSFVLAYPESTYVPDAKLALEKMQEAETSN